MEFLGSGLRGSKGVGRLVGQVNHTVQVESHRTLTCAAALTWFVGYSLLCPGPITAHQVEQGRWLWLVPAARRELKWDTPIAGGFLRDLTHFHQEQKVRSQGLGAGSEVQQSGNTSPGVPLLPTSLAPSLGNELAAGSHNNKTTGHPGRINQVRGGGKLTNYFVILCRCYSLASHHTWSLPKLCMQHTFAK